MDLSMLMKQNSFDMDTLPDMEEIKDLILAEYKKGNVVVSTFDGLKVCELHDLLDQPAEGLLYDLNRDTGTILTCLNDPKWVNDYALSRVVIALKEKVAELETNLLNIELGTDK